MEPPMSVPIPKQEPRKPTKAPSPPEEPPAVRVVLKGLTVTLSKLLAWPAKLPDGFYPYKLLLVSKCIRVCG